MDKKNKEVMDLLAALDALATQKGQASAKVGSDLVLVLSADYLRGLLAKAEQNPNKTQVLVILDKVTKKLTDSLLN